MREAALLFAVFGLFPLASASADSICDTDPRSRACAMICEADDPPEACAQVCLNETGVAWCTAYCVAHPDRSCLDPYGELPPCLAYGGAMLRFGFRGALAAQIRDAPGASLGAQMILGVRVSPNISLIAKLRAAPIGLDANLDWILSAGAELGAEGMVFDLFAARTALAVSASAGLWLPSYCRSNTPCPFAVPMASVEVDHVMFGDSPDPFYGMYSAWSVGVEAGLGYDPWLGGFIGRVSLLVGVELAAH